MKRFLPFAIILACVIGIQVLTSCISQTFYLTQLTMAAYYTVVVIGLCMLMGYAGQISLGHAGFFAIGGYISAALTTTDLSAFAKTGAGVLFVKSGVLTIGKDLYGSSVVLCHPWAACAVAIIVTIAIACIIGLPVLRLKGHYLAMATLGFGSIIYKVVLGTKVLGGADGICSVPAFPLAFGLQVSGSTADRIPNYYIAWAIVIIVALLMHNLLHSRAGRALRAIHGNEEAASAMGINTAQYKFFLFVTSAVVAAIAGVFLTHFNGGIGPSEASITKSVRYVSIVAVGGMANLWSAIFASVVLNFLSLRGYFGTYDEAVFGIILVVAMLFAPNGIRIKKWLKKKE